MIVETTEDKSASLTNKRSSEDPGVRSSEDLLLVREVIFLCSSLTPSNGRHGEGYNKERGQKQG